MSEATPPRNPARVSNEVLEERVGQFYNHVNENLIGIRNEIKGLAEANSVRMGRLEDRVLFLDQRIQDHGQTAGHGESLLRVGQLEKVVGQIQSEMRALSKVATLEASVARAEAESETLKTRITTLERERDEAQGRVEGRQNTLGAMDRFFMLVVAGVPTALLLISLLEK